MVLSVCKCVKVCCLLGHRGPRARLIRWRWGVAKLQRAMVCRTRLHKVVAWTAALLCLSLFVSSLFVCVTLPALFYLLLLYFSSSVAPSDLDPHETLLHFSARRGLSRVTHFLLQQPGAREALRLANREGHTPSVIAAQRGHERLHELLIK